MFAIPWGSRSRGDPPRGNTRRAWIVGLLLLGGGAGGAPAPPFRLADAHDRWTDVSFPSGSVRVLAFAGRRGAGQLRDWIEPLAVRYGDRIEVHGIALLGEVPRLMRPIVRRLFRREPGDRVLLDWTGETEAAYELEGDAATLIVVRPDGGIERRVTGPADPVALAALMDCLDALLEEAGQPGCAP